MQPPTQKPATAFTNNFQQQHLYNKQQIMNKNANNGPIRSKIKPSCIQILGSDPDESHLLCYCATEDEWNKHLKRSNIYDPNKPKYNNNIIPSHTLSTAGGPDQKDNSYDYQKYSIISIMGPQSSGKSTLLNELFGTQFEVMDHTQTRKQVTTGIWMGSCPKATDLMILDLEGTDSMERKQNRSNFERQTSLMALTLSEVLIINLWASDIGRSAGMNIDTLRAILAANLRLFQKPNTKTILLFVVREQSPNENDRGVTPAAELTKIIHKVLMGIWNEIEKPDNFADTPITDLFDIDYFFFPPLNYYKDLFKQKVRQLYDRFTNTNNSNYYFNKSYHFTKCVPPEDLFAWTKQIFEAITSDDTLNIPDQQKLLSAFRCEKSSFDAYTLFTEHSKVIAEEVRSKYVAQFGEKLNQIINECMFQYNETARKYDKEVAKEKYVQLVDKIETQVLFLFGFQYKHLVEKTLDVYQTQMEQALPNGVCADNLEQIFDNVGEYTRKYFSMKIQECLIKTTNDKFLDKEAYWKETHKRLRETTKAIQAEQWQLLCRENENLADQYLLSKIGKLLRKPDDKIWNKISLLRIEYFGNYLNKQILSKLNNLMYDPNKLRSKQKSLKQLSDSLIINRCKKYCARMDSVLQDRFNYLFNKDPLNNGIPRQWNESLSSKIDEIFVNSKDQCLEILKLSNQIVLRENVDLDLSEIRLKLLSSDTIDDIRSDFLRFADDQYKLAQDSIRRSSQQFGGILPSHPVTWLIFLFFAKDEIWSMLTNPLYLISIILGSLILLIGYQAHSYGMDIKSVIFSLFNRVLQLSVNELTKFQQKQIDIQKKKRLSSGSIDGKMRRPLNNNNNTPDINTPSATSTDNGTANTPNSTNT